MRPALLLMVLIGASAALPADATAQGTWVYREFNGTTYSNMTFNPSDNLWHGSHQFCLIGDGWMHPDVNEAALGWVAPVAGTVTIQGHIERPRLPGDGVLARIVLNGTRLWPTANQQDVSPRFMVQHALVANVQAGDIIYFHVGQKGDANNDVTWWRPSVTYGVGTNYVTDAAAFVMGPADLARVGIPLMDASLSKIGGGPLGGAGGSTWFHSQATHQVFSGSLDAPATTPIADRTDAQMFTNLSAGQGHPWFNNIYQHSDGSYLAFLHVEGATRPGGAQDGMRIALAHSTTPTSSWRYLGHIIIPFGDPSGSPQSGYNITGVPYIIKDGWFYIYFTDAPFQRAVARARVDDVMAAAWQGTTSPWTKYCNGSWSAPGLGGCAADLNLPSIGLHGDGAWSTRGTYVLSGYGTDTGRGVWIAFSQDGLNWSSWSWLQRGIPGICEPVQQWGCTASPYITIVAEDGSDNGVVGNSFWVYWAFGPDWGDGPYPLPNYSLQYVARQRVTLIGP